MGNTWVVLAWMPVTDGVYDWMDVYRGQSCLAALWHAYRVKSNGVGCVKVEWR